MKMTVLDAANLMLFSCQRKLTILRAKKDLGTKTELDEEIKSYEDDIKYWTAYIEGVKAQRNEHASKHSDKETDEEQMRYSEEMIMRSEDE